MAEEIAVENRISNFQGLVTLTLYWVENTISNFQGLVTLTLYRVILHTVVHH